MQATILHIESRERERISQFAILNDFTYQQGERINAQQIIDNPNLSLYCLDDIQQQAVFTELPPDVDLANAPFCYQAQFDNAQKLVIVSYDVLHELAKQIDVDTSKLIIIHNIGRCGSTLLHQIFNQIDNLICFSELDVFSNFVMLRHHNQSTLIKLLESCMRFVFRPTMVGQSTIYGLKFRNQCVDIMDLYVKAFPQAKHLFMYRNAVDWISSLYRLFSRHGGEPPIMTRTDAITDLAAYFNRTPETIEKFFDPTVAGYSVFTYLATSWLVMMNCYMELYNQGTVPLAVRYEDLNTQREEVLAGVFNYCDLPVSAIETAVQAFTQDSQRGTRLARDNPQVSNTLELSNTQIEEIHAVLKRHPIIQMPDYILPGTVAIS